LGEHTAEDRGVVGSNAMLKHAPSAKLKIPPVPLTSLKKFPVKYIDGKRLF